MARLKFRTDGTIALFDPSDDPFPPFPDAALLHLPPTLPPQAADQAQPQLPTEIPPAQAQLQLPAVQSEAAADASSLALELTPALTQAEEFCPRTLSFTIPGGSGNPGVLVTAVEHQVNGVKTGTIDFTVDVLGNADLRGLFFQFNPAHLDGLRVTGGDGLITKTVIQADSVINLGQGVEMNGAASPFDVGIRWGTPGPNTDFINFPVHFTLSNPNQFLTVDDIAHLEFGARLAVVGGQDAKITVIAPAAPDAHDDAFHVFEDGTSNPSHVPVGTQLPVLANDTDADNDTLIVTDAHGAQHGTVRIVDGPDADLLPGDVVLYTPFADYSGPDSFVYCVSDGHGSQDNATANVTVDAVADIPDLTYMISSPDNAREIIIDVTATQTDLDLSEFIDRIELSGLPTGVTAVPLSVNPGTEPDQLMQQFVLTVPEGADIDFDLVVTAVSKEESNGDEEVNVAHIPIQIEFNSNSATETFLATDQSIWATGDEFTFTDDRFIGIDDHFDKGFNFFVFGSVEGDLKAGFQSTLTFEGGEIDASLTYDITVNTTFNKTTDTLTIESSKMLVDGSFTTEGPEGSYVLDAILNYFFHVEAGLDFLIDDVTLLDTDVGPSDNTINLIDFTSDDLQVEIPFAGGAGTITLQWPDIDTSSAGDTTDPFSASGQSNNFLELGLDVDEALAQIFLGGVNPFDLDIDVDIAIASAEGSAELLDFDVFGGLNFLQNFLMDEQGLAGVLHFEDGTNTVFAIGDDITLQNASAIDAAGNNNGVVDFTLELTPDVDLTNDTDLGFDVGYSFELFKASGSYDLFGIESGSFSVGPVVNIDDDLIVATVDVYQDTFALNFGSQDLLLAA
jgi:hypothetical protein